MRKNSFLLALAVTIGCLVQIVATPVSVNAVSANQKCNAYILTFPAWYNNLSSGTPGNCKLMSPADFSTDTEEGLKTYVGIIGLNTLNILIQLVAYVCTGFIIFGGYRYMTSAGDSSGIAAGKKTVLNAVVGLVLALVAVIVIQYLARNIGAN